VEAETFQPVWHRDLSFATLNAALESIPVADLPSCDGLTLPRPHRRSMPYYVEGYHVPDPQAEGAELVPKGIEIRTPVCGSIEEAVALLLELHTRMQPALAALGYQAVALSHHPTEDRFDGPQGARRFDQWQWAKEVMLTYGPDVNVGLPARLADRIDESDLLAKINFYAPAVVALTLASPLHRGEPWAVDGRVGKSLRTYRRSVSGQAWRWHPHQGGRLEFKGFEMTHRLGDFQAYFLLWLEILLDDGLRGRAGNQSRVYNLGAVARDGLAVETIGARAAEVLERAPATLAAWGFDAQPLSPFVTRLTSGVLPADEILALYEREGSIPGLLRHLTPLVPVEATPTASALVS